MLSLKNMPTNILSTVLERLLLFLTLWRKSGFYSLTGIQHRIFDYTGFSSSITNLVIGLFLGLDSLTLTVSGENLNNAFKSERYVLYLY